MTIAKLRAYLIIYTAKFVNGLIPGLKKAREKQLEQDIYHYLGKPITLAEADEIAKKYKMRVSWEEWGIRCLKSPIVKFQFELETPVFDHFRVTNNMAMLPLGLKWNDKFDSVKQKFGEPDAIDYKDNMIYYFDKNVRIKFHGEYGSGRIIDELVFIKHLKGDTGFLDLKNREHFKKKNLNSKEPDMPVSFGYKWFWYAVRATDMKKVGDIMNLKSVSDCNWQAGINHVMEKGGIFITPPVDGWIMILGDSLPFDDSKIDKIKELLNKLSKEFGEAQFFETSRVAEYHFWVRSVNGDVTRAYSYLGEKGENLRVEGEPTDYEKKFSLVNTFSEEAKNKNYLERDDLVIPDEEFLMKLAGNWSVNPSELENRKDLEKGLGLLSKKK